MFSKIISLFLIIIIIDDSQQQNCSQDIVDGCFNTLMMIGDINFKFPESTTDLQTHCR